MSLGLTPRREHKYTSNKVVMRIFGPKRKYVIGGCGKKS
jgi:hypothetical protein